MRRSVLFLREISYHKITGIERATESEYLSEMVKEGNISICDGLAWINVRTGGVFFVKCKSTHRIKRMLQK